MQIEENEYLQEKKYALIHLLFVVTLTIISFLLIHTTNRQLNPNLFLVKVLLLGLSFVSSFYYVMVVKQPFLLVIMRKYIILIFDLLVLVTSISLMGEQGVFLLPLYILIVMESGINLGLRYFYFTIIFSSFSWLWLILYSEYWQTNTDLVSVFAVTTWLLPFMYLKKILNMHQIHDELHESLVSTSFEANYDSLTGLVNRKYFDEYIYELINQKEFFAMLFIDLNKFKAINDTYGHDVGDEVLMEISKRLAIHLDEEDMLARLGGDEFVILTKRKKVFLPKFIQKLERDAIGKHQIENIMVHIELSIGISLYPDDSKIDATLRKYADEAMYIAKKAPNRHHIFYDEIKSKN